MQVQNCFLLSYIKFGDNDAVLHCFSAENGYQSFFVRGIYSPKNKKKSHFFPLNLLNITVQNSRRIGVVPAASKIESVMEFNDYGDVEANSVLFFVADFLNQILKEEQQNHKAFSEIYNFRKELSGGNRDAHVALLFKFMLIGGIVPLLNENKFLNPQSGMFSEKISHPDFDEEISQIWKKFLNYEDCYQVSLKRSQRNRFLNSVLEYYRLHIDGFYIPNSLDVLRQVYS